MPYSFRNQICWKNYFFKMEIYKNNFWLDLTLMYNILNKSRSQSFTTIIFKI
uniref:Uncharacterized protein n=1 Tax=Heterorhabditis bacteriophora TaxID=37862 RepID=A0A1I7WJD5_HETBA